jgi:hypothetical protein
LVAHKKLCALAQITTSDVSATARSLAAVAGGPAADEQSARCHRGGRAAGRVRAAYASHAKACAQVEEELYGSAVDEPAYQVAGVMVPVMEAAADEQSANRRHKKSTPTRNSRRMLPEHTASVEKVNSQG